MPSIPLIDDLTKTPVPKGSFLLVEFDPASQWQNASVYLAAEWLRNGGGVCYTTLGQQPAKVRSRLNRFGINAEELESDGKLVIVDAYTSTLRKKSTEKYASESSKVQDLSIMYSQTVTKPYPERDLLRIVDNGSVLARYNDEKSFIEFVVTRVIPAASAIESTTVTGIISGLHSEKVYRTIEASVDGIIDFRLNETGEETRDLVRIRTMRDVGYDRRWHQLKIGENLEVTLAK